MDEEKFIKDNQKLIDKVVLSFTKNRDELDDYKQQAALITLKVLRSKTFDPTRSKMTTYLFRSLRSGLERYRIKQSIIAPSYTYKNRKNYVEPPVIKDIQSYEWEHIPIEKDFSNFESSYDTYKFKELLNYLTPLERDVANLKYFNGDELISDERIKNTLHITEYQVKKAKINIKNKLKRRIEWLRKNKMMV